MSRLSFLLVATVVAGAACSTEEAQQTTDGPQVAAIVASYDLAADDPARFLVGLTGPEFESVAYGSVEVAFRPADQTGDATASPAATARFLPLPGQDVDDQEPGPAFVEASEALGVYATGPVAFDQDGYWEAVITGSLDDEPFEVTAAFEVLARHEVPTVGDEAPRTANPVLGDPDLDLSALDSRADDGQPVPDPALHQVRISDAIRSGRPLVVVVSTPTYCQSRFCGPITDAVAELAAQTDGAVAFVHLEVWADFVERRLNPAAAEWIETSGPSEGREPWVFVVDRSGTIRYRFDNVAGDAELRRAVDEVARG